jgi:starvation-inducible outer membrane lipoprotein
MKRRPFVWRVALVAIGALSLSACVTMQLAREEEENRIQKEKDEVKAKKKALLNDKLNIMPKPTTPPPAGGC